MTSTDMTVLPGEVLVAPFAGDPVFPAMLVPGSDSAPRPLFRLPIAARIVDWIADRHIEDPELPDAEWDGDDIVITQFASNESSSQTRVAPDGDDRYAICPHWPWAVPARPAPTVFDHLLSYATRFTFDGNTVAPGQPGWDPRLVVHVEQAGTDEWCVTRDALVLNLVEFTWGVRARGSHEPRCCTADLPRRPRCRDRPRPERLGLASGGSGQPPRSLIKP